MSRKTQHNARRRESHEARRHLLTERDLPIEIQVTLAGMVHNGRDAAKVLDNAEGLSQQAHMILLARRKEAEADRATVAEHRRLERHWSETSCGMSEDAELDEEFFADEGEEV